MGREKNITFGSSKAQIIVNSQGSNITILSLSGENLSEKRGCLLRIELLARRMNLTEIWAPFNAQEGSDELFLPKGYRYTQLGIHPDSKELLQGYKKVLRGDKFNKKD